MHIAQVAPLTEAIPPKLYGGTERVVSWLTEELIALGHDVTLFASGDSVTSAQLEAVWPRALRLDGAVRDPNALHMLLLERFTNAPREFDILHCHLDYYPFSLFSRQPTPFVTTLHGRLDLPEHQPVFDDILVDAGGVDLEFAAAAVAAGQLGANRSSRSAGRNYWRRSRSSRPISHSSAALRRRRASTAPSASPSIAACRSKSPPKSTKPTVNTSTNRIKPMMKSARC